MIKHAALFLTLATLAVVADAQTAKPEKPVKNYSASVNPLDAKNKPSGIPLPPEDPELEKYYMEEKTAPLPPVTAAVDTVLPLVLQQGDHVVFIGNTLFDRGAQFPHFEAMLLKGHADKQLVVRTLAWSADEVDLMPRPTNFGTLNQHLHAQKADVIFAAFGFNESFGGLEKLPDFKLRLTALVQELKTHAYNGKAAPRVVLVSPIANENVQGVPAADMNNARLAAYTQAMGEVAAEQKVGFANVFEPMLPAMKGLTFNGVHLEDKGYAMFGEALYRAAFEVSAPETTPELRAAIADKNRQFFQRYRPLNGFYYTGDRNKDYGYLDFLPAMRSFDFMVANRDQRIWEVAQGKSFAGKKVDDSNVPEMPATKESKGANEWMTPANELAAFKVDPRFEVNLFASEEQFPEIANPIQIRWDTSGRMWVSTSQAYPHLYPGQEPHDRLIILEDTDNDGRADKSTVWADNLQIPLAFEFGDGGVYVSDEPHLTFLKDTDGDGKADFSRQMFTGFGTEDSHHALHDFVWSPDGDLIIRDSIFLHSQIETAYGPVRLDNSGWFRLRTDTQKLSTFGSYPSTNPWGVTFDDWGHHMASHPIFASAFHATNPPYPEQHPGAGKIPAYSGTCGQEFVDFDFWPEELQGGFIKARYKPTNNIEMHQWIEMNDHYEEKKLGDLIFSTNLSFIPTDVKAGPRGDFYICDWYNPIKGHAQYSLRDPRRLRTSGRIWRIVPKGAKLAEPPTVAGAPIPALLDLLKSPHYRWRYQAKRELHERYAPEVKTALDAWVAKLDPKEARFRHHQLEALWTYRTLSTENRALLKELLNCDEHHARAAATTQLRFIDLPDRIEQLRARANDANGLVRMEAVLAASYIGTKDALDAVLVVLDKPLGEHLTYAVRTALGSEALSRHWMASENPRITAFMDAFAANYKRGPFEKKKTAEETAFDKQPGVTKITINCVRERMLFDKTEFSVKAGQPVSLVFNNPDATAHNLALCQPGSVEEIGLAGNEMAKDPEGIKKDFIPVTDKILHHTKLLNPNSTETLRFNAPTAAGDYPYLCTFPGHWVIMRGMMHVK
ncbi:MAG: HEAT repeat domain-containing protein [Prosthecobacter sp.]|uniref:PVC-type heme-binding CxxCH protein n=1 Tax=Prosthecobacter sp. TaxID=1965333 RepID=UPI0025F62F82|nr:PVC-type heme-binding CxxCH protein [Prosthecobacter sp.]MCF7785497.1 HEAT repeat domain-containing protein [Prosthecobacter sp.]